MIPYRSSRMRRRLSSRTGRPWPPPASTLSRNVRERQHLNATRRPRASLSVHRHHVKLHVPHPRHLQQVFEPPPTAPPANRADAEPAVPPARSRARAPGPARSPPCGPEGRRAEVRPRSPPTPPRSRLVHVPLRREDEPRAQADAQGGVVRAVQDVSAADVAVGVDAKAVPPCSYPRGVRRTFRTASSESHSSSSWNSTSARMSP